MNPATQAWEMALPILSDRLHPTAIITWFDDLVPISFNGDTLILSTPNAIKKNFLEIKFLNSIKEVFSELFSEEIQVVIKTAHEENIVKETAVQTIDDKYTFDHFIVGTSNNFAHSAAKAISTAVSNGANLTDPSYNYNPFFLYGNSGLGKTHLMNSISSVVKSKRENAKIIYIKCEEFTNDLIQSIGDGTGTSFRDKYRQADLLLIDDVQFMAGKKQTQEEFFHTFEALYNENKQIVMTSDKPPKEINNLEERLSTRFAMGLIADVSPPDYETRIAIIKSKTSKMGINFPDDVCDYIAKTVSSNVRQLEGTVNKMKAQHDFSGAGFDMALAEKSVKDIFTESPGLNPTPELIIKEVAKYYNISADKIKSKNRSRDTVQPRQVAMYLSRDLTSYSLPEIGKFFEKDHTTVMHSISKIEKLLVELEEMKKVIEDLKKNIKNL